MCTAKVIRCVISEKPYYKRLGDQLVTELCNNGQIATAVLKEIDALEGVGPSSTTKQPKPFSRIVLNGWWHKHYSTSQHIPKNVENHWNSKRMRVSRSKLNEKLESIEQASTDIPDDVLWHKSGEIAGEIVDGHLQRKELCEQTGEWIVYSVIDGVNYYFGLGKHDESDEDLLNRIVSGSTNLASFTPKN